MSNTRHGTRLGPGTRRHNRVALAVVARSPRKLRSLDGQRVAGVAQAPPVTRPKFAPLSS